MEIDRKMVEYVAELSKLRLTEPEKELMQQDLSKRWSRSPTFPGWKTCSARMWPNPALRGKKSCKTPWRRKRAASRCPKQLSRLIKLKEGFD